MCKKNNTITVRDRYTTKQVRVPTERVVETIRALLNNTIEFEHAGQEVE